MNMTNVRQTLKDLIFKQAEHTEVRKEGEPMPDGRREGESDNPYLCARRTWNDYIGAQVAARQTWQMMGLLSLAIALAGVVGMVYIGSQSKFIPYVVEVDKLGQTIAVSPVGPATGVDPRIIHSAMANFIQHARIVTPDVALQRKAIFAVYSMLVPADAATARMNEYLNGREEANPFKRAEKETVNTEIISVLPLTESSWQVEWLETVRDRQGFVKIPPYRMRATVTMYVTEASPDVSEEQIRNNPLGIYVRDFAWAKQV